MTPDELDDTDRPDDTVRTVTARSPEDLLALAPVLLGFWPSESVVMLTFGGPRPFHARLDLPARASTQELVQVEEAMLGPASAHGVRAIAVLVYGDRERIARAVVRTLGAGARRRGIEVLVCLWSERGRFRIVGGPAGVGEPVPYDVSSHPFVVRAIVDGRLSFRSREEMVASLEPDEAACARVRMAIARLAPSDSGPGTIEVRRALHRPEDRLGDAAVARLIRSVRTVAGRDAAMGLVDRRNADQHRALWASVLPRTPEDLVAPVADLLAFAAWQAGDGALAWAAIDRARRADPGDRLARVLTVLLENAVPPDAWSVTPRPRPA